MQKVFDISAFNILQTIGAAREISASQASLADANRLDSFVNKNYNLLTYDKNVWMELSNRALTSSGAYNTLSEAVIEARKNAEEAIAALKEKYHF